MKKVLITLILMSVFMVFGGGAISLVLSSILGGSVDQSYIYPIYGGIIILAGIVVGCTCLISEKIAGIKKDIEEIKNKKKT